MSLSHRRQNVAAGDVYVIAQFANPREVEARPARLIGGGLTNPVNHWEDAEFSLNA